MKNKIVILTGASVGIGRATAVEFSKQGAVVGLVARSIYDLNKTLDLVKKNKGSGEIFPTDLTDVNAIEKLAKDVKRKWNRVDILVNVAGVWHNKEKAYYGINFTDYSTDEILETYGVGITAPTLLSHKLIPIMKKGSKIINISGTFESGAKGWLPYFVSKKAIEDLTIGLSQELEGKGIQVNCISPSDVATEPYKKFFPEYATPENALHPEDVAKQIVSLASENSNITGQIIVVKKGSP